MKVIAFGGFEDWRVVIGGILEHSGITGFLENLNSLYEETDSDTPQFEQFLEVWYSIWKDEPKTTSEISRHIESGLVRGDRHLYEALPDDLRLAYDKRSFTRSLGKRLARMCDAVLPNGYKITRFGVEHRAISWGVKKIETPRNDQRCLISEIDNTIQSLDQTPQTRETPKHKGESGGFGVLSEKGNSPNFHTNSSTDSENIVYNPSGELGVFLSKSVNREKKDSTYIGYSEIGIDQNKLPQTPKLPTPPTGNTIGNTPPSNECDHTTGNTNPEIKLEEWRQKHNLPILKPPGEYRFVTSTGASRCSCRGCDEPPLRNVKGMYPLCQKHFTEYQSLWQQEEGVK